MLKQKLCILYNNTIEHALIIAHFKTIVLSAVFSISSHLSITVLFPVGILFMDLLKELSIFLVR